MKIFTIENEINNITAHATVQEAEAVTNAERFRNEAGLAKLAANWPASRLIEISNSLPDVAPVKKFKDRATAVSRIWKALQSLGLTESTEVAPETDVAEPEIETDATPATIEVVEAAVAPMAIAVKESPAVESATPEAPQTPDVAPTEVPATKKATRREGGTTLSELMSSTGWQKHSVRGFLSGTVGKKLGLHLVSAKGQNGERVYSIQA
jgi:hypothetical protein